MGFSCGIVGLPNVGKSTLFNALTKLNVEASNYPFCTIDANHGIVSVPDKRVDTLSQISKSEKTLYTTVEFVDIAGLVKGASEGEGLGNQFLSNIRECDAIIHIVRLFENPNITKEGIINPSEDIEIIHLELILSDLSLIEKHLQATQKKIKGKATPEDLEKKIILKRFKKILESESLLSKINFNPEEKKLIKELNLLTIKPMLIICNIDEREISTYSKNKIYQKLEDDCQTNQFKLLAIAVQLEKEFSEIENEAEQEEFLQIYGLKESSLKQLIKKSYEILDLVTFLTTGEKESKAWTVKKNTPAPKGASVIHSSFEKKFIKAEVVSYQDFHTLKSYSKCRENGKIRIEGKKYLLQDGDICIFKTQN